MGVAPAYTMKFNREDAQEALDMGFRVFVQSQWSKETYEDIEIYGPVCCCFTSPFYESGHMLIAHPSASLKEMGDSPHVKGVEYVMDKKGTSKAEYDCRVKWCGAPDYRMRPRIGVYKS